MTTEVEDAPLSPDPFLQKRSGSEAAATWDELDRLAALESYGILDTPREPQFDDIVRLASDIFDAPIAVVNLIASGRQWFKAEVGIGADELPLDVSICAHAILQPNIFVVPDLELDQRFANNPLVVGGPGLRFYAGALLETPDGLPLGTVCVLDTKPRPQGISDRERLTLQVLANQVMSQFELRRAIAERDRQTEAMNLELLTRRQVGAALQETTRRLDAVLNNTRMAVFLMDDRQQCVYANAAAEKLTGYRFAEMSGRVLHDVVHHTRPDGSHYPLEECPIDRAFPERAQMSGTELFVAPDGSFYPVAFTASPVLGEDGRPIGTVIEARNIAEELARDAALHENEARLRALTDNLPAGMVYQVATGVDGSARRFLYVSGSHERLTGVPAEAVLADPTIPYRLLHPDDHARMAEAEAEAVLTRRSFDVQVRFRRADGELRWCRVISAPREQPDGSLIWDGIQIDTTDQKLGEEALRASEDRLRELNDSLEAQVAERTKDRDRMWRLSTDIMLVAQIDGTINSVNPAWTSALGWGERELIGNNFMELVHPDDCEATQTELARLGAGATTFRFENRYKASDGGHRWISWTAVPGDDLIHAVGRDVTADKIRQAELQTAQEALRQSQKMEAMGQLTGGVAHDFNNLLTPIVGSLDMLVRRGLGSERERRLIDGALQSAERAKILVQRLLAFARRQPLQPQSVDLRRLVAGMADLISSTSGPNIEVRVRLPDDMPPAWADANQVEMAILNLAVNARDAMPDGGLLTISAVHEVVGPEQAQLPPGGYVRLAITDTGFGMDEATLARAIEPFFSTKGIGKGTGLGLSMAHGLALQLNGRLHIASTPGKGTIVELWLPVSHAPASEGSRELDTPIASQNRGAALLVDDEDLVRMSTADMLLDLGYQVTEATSAEEALRLIENGLAPSLLVTDHLMPGMNGADFARLIRSRRPDLPILIVSGYAETEGIAPDIVRLSKPFRKAELAESLSTLTGAAS